MRDTILLFLLNQRNDYQADMQRAAGQAARRLGLTLEVHDAGNSSDRQLQQILSALRGASATRAIAFLVHPVFDGMHEEAAREAARKGIGWVLLNRSGTYAESLRRAHPDLPIFCVTPDQEQTGVCQGQIAATLLPRGGEVLYITGPLSASSARLRRTGMERTLRGSSIRISQVHGDWTAESGTHAVRVWEMRAGNTEPPLDLVVSQNDAMAAAAREALAAVAHEHHWPRLATVPAIGSDGVRDFGVRLVREKVLSATVIAPGTAAPAIDAIGEWRRSGHMPAFQIQLAVSPYPDLTSLSPISAG